MATPHTQRIKADSTAAKDTAQLNATLWRGRAAVIQVGLFERGAAASLAGITSLTLLAKAARTATATVISKTVLAAALTPCSTAQWTAGTHQHAAITLTAAEANVAMTAKSRVLHLVVKAQLSTGDEIIFGVGTLTVHDANAEPAGDPPENPEPAISGAAAAALVAEATGGLKTRLSVDEDALHFYDAAGVYLGSMPLVDMAMPDLD